MTLIAEEGDRVQVDFTDPRNPLVLSEARQPQSGSEVSTFKNMDWNCVSKLGPAKQ